MRSGPDCAGGSRAGDIAGAAAAALLGTKSTVATAAVGAIGIPVAPPFDNGATARAFHCCRESTGGDRVLGNDAQATPLQRSASTPALFQPGVGQPCAMAWRIGCVVACRVNMAF